MLALRSMLRTNTKVLKNVAQQRNMSVVSIPARNKASTGEMVFLSALMVIGWSAVPAWVLVNIKNYRDKEN